MTDNKKTITKKDLPPKVQELMELPYADDVIKMIKAQKTLKEIRVYLVSKGFKISTGYIGKFKEYINQNNTEDKYLLEFLDQGRLSDRIFRSPKSLVTKEDKLKSDLDFIDDVIQEGAKRFKDDMQNVDITLYDVFQAISLKDKITGGASYGLTNYGVKYLAQLTEEKYYRIISILMEYVPKDKKEEVINLIEVAEEDFYSQTEYYEEYLKARGFKQEEIVRRMRKNDESNKSTNK